MKSLFISFLVKSFAFLAFRMEIIKKFKSYITCILFEN